ncbi:putative Na+(Or H+)/acetate symporter ActP [uncultured Defluviicoccus sp.]|uniref:Putative Na+(Or H+)/acetate symporter ActP n=1 Tax=metagenome TaxID=256318 RepID=A0A380TD69_9ZZZZ|nr:putative Na+(Or H+)/acetate symporter ActP [uncultured Defluviicoccus sp.]
MIRLFLTALFSALPFSAFAQQAAPQYYTFEPSATFSTLGISYTIAMMVAFLAVGWYAKSRVSTSDDYFAAGRSFGGISNGLAMSSNYMSLATFLGFTALLWRLQYYLIAITLSFLGGFVLISIAMAPALRRWGKYTSMQFIGERFGHTAKIVAVLCMIFLAQLYLIGQMKGTGNVFQVMFHWDYTTGMVVGGLVVTAYVTIGGMYGMSYNQTLQAIIMGLALIIPTAIILWNIGAGPASVFPPFGYGSLVPEMEKALPSYFDPFLTVNGTVPMSLKFHIGIILSIAFGTIGLPHIAMRYFTAPSIRNAKISTLWGAFFVGLIFFTTFAVGFAAKLYTVQVLNQQMNLQVQPKEADLLLVVMSQAFTPTWIAALPIAGALAAGFSTIAGLLMVIGTGIGHDIYSTISPNADDKKKVKMGYLFTALGGLATIVLALDPPDFLLTSVIWAFVVAASTFTPVLILGIWWKGANTLGAIAGLVVGGVLSGWLWFSKGVFFGFPLIQAGPVGNLVTGIFTVSAAWFTVVVVSLLTGGEKDEKVLREIDRIHGWRNYDPKRYSSKTFAVVTAAIALLLMIWSAMPDPAYKKKAELPAQPTITVAAVAQHQ